MNLGTLLITLGVDTSGLNVGTQAIKKFETDSKSSIDQVSASLERTSNQFQRFGSAATRYLTLPLTLIGGGAIKMAADFEFANQKIVALAGVSQAQVDAWQGMEKRLAIESNTAFKDVANTMYYVASAGIDAKNTMEITEVAAKAAAIGLGEMDSMARLLTYAINAYGSANITAMEAADAVTVAVREGTAEAGTMVGVIGDLIPVASALGVSFGEITGSIAAMTRTGFNAFKSATSLRQIMVSLLNPTVEAENALNGMSKKLNDASFSADGLRRVMREKGLFEALTKVNELVKEFGDEAAGIVFGNVRALTGDLSLTGKNIENVREVIRMAREETGAFKFAFEVMTQTMQFKMGQVKMAVSEAFLTLGQAMMGPVISIMHRLETTIRNITTWFKGLSEWTQVVVLKFGALLAIIGPLGLYIAAMIKVYDGVRLVVLAVSWAFTTLTITLRQLAVVMAANPWMAAATAFILIATAIYQAVAATKALSDIQKAAINIERSASQSVVEEKIALERLVNIVKSDIATKAQKEAAIARINAISPVYLGHIDEEAIKTGKAGTAIATYINKLKDKAKAQASYELLVEAEKKKIEDMASGADQKIPFMTKFAIDFGVSKSNLNPVNMVNPMIKAIESAGSRINYVSNKIAKNDSLIAYYRSVCDKLAVTVDNFEELKTAMEGVDKTMADFNEKDRTGTFKAGDLAPLIETKKTIDKQIAAEQDYTNYLSTEYDKRLANDKEYQSLKARNSEVWLNNESDSIKEQAAEEMRNRRDWLTKDIEAREQANQLNLANYAGYLDMLNAWTNNLPKSDFNFGGRGGGGTDKAKTLEQQLSAIMEAMMTASGAHLISLGQEYTSLERLIKKQKDLIALTLERIRYDNELNQPKNRTTYDQQGVPESQSLKIQMELDTRALEKYNTYLQALTDSGIYAGAEVDMLKDKVISLNTNLVETTYAKGLQDIGLQAGLLGGDFNRAEKEIQLTQTAIEGLTAQYDEARDKGNFLVANMLHQSIALKQSRIDVLTVDIAYKKLQDTLSLIYTSEEILGDQYSSTSEQLQAYRSYLDTLMASMSKAQRVGLEYSITLAKIGFIKSIISTTELAEVTETLNEQLKLIHTTESVLGGQYDETSAEIEVQTTALTKLIKSLNSVEKGSEKWLKIQQQITNTKASKYTLEYSKIIEDYNKALDTNNIKEQVHGRLYNERLGQIDADIKLNEDLLDLQIEYGLATEDTIAALKDLYKLRNKEENKAEFTKRAANEAKQLFNQLMETTKASDSLKQALSGIAEVGAFLAADDPDPYAALMAGITTMITAIDNLHKKQLLTLQWYRDILAYQIEYNILLNEQSKIQSGRNIYVTDYAKQIKDITSALQGSKEGMQNALTMLMPDPRGLFQVKVEYESINAFLQNSIVKTGEKWNKLGTESWNTYDKILNVYPELLDANGKLNIEVAKSLTANESLWNATNTWQKEGLEGLTSWYAQNEKNLADLDAAILNLTGNIGNNLFNAVSEAWDKGEDAFAIYKTTVSQGLEDIMKQMIWNAIMAADLLQLKNDLSASFDPLTGDMNVTDDFSKFLDNTINKVKLVTDGWTAMQEVARSKGFTFDNVSNTKLFDSSNIASTISEGIIKGLQSGEGYLKDFTTGFGELISKMITESLTSSIENSPEMTNFREALARFQTPESAGGVLITNEELAALDKYYLNLVKIGEANYSNVKGVLDLYKTVNLIDTNSAADSIFDSISQGVKLAEDGLGGFAESFGTMLKGVILKNLTEALAASSEMANFNSFLTYAQSDTSQGGKTITFDEEYMLKAIWEGVVAAGEVAWNAVSFIWDEFPNEAVAKTEALFDANDMASKIYDGITQGFKLGQESLGDFTKTFGEILRQTISKEITAGMVTDINGSYTTKYKEFSATSSEGGTKITKSEWEELSFIAQTIIANGKAAYDTYKALFAEFPVDTVTEPEKVDSLFNVDSIANNIFDGIKNGFELGQGSLGDFAEGFGALLTDTLSKSVITAMTNQLNSGFITKMTEFMGAGSKGGTAITPEELALLDQLYKTVVTDGKKAWDTISPIVDSYNKKPDTQLTGSVTGMSLDQASLLAGQLTAARYDLRSMSGSMERVAKVSEQSGNYQLLELGHLKDISANTKKTNEEAIPELVNAVKETNRLITTLWQ